MYLFSPMLLATAAEQFGYKLMYAEYLGGSVAFFWSHFNQINGYPNRLVVLSHEIDMIRQNLSEPFLIFH